MSDTPKTPGQVAYERYFLYSDGKSLISLAPLPEWKDVRADIKGAWEAAAQAAIDARPCCHSWADVSIVVADNGYRHQTCTKCGVEL